MGSHFSIDTNELRMFARYEWWDFGDDCDHNCDHTSTMVIGWGPNVATYELEQCNDCGCRAWRDGRYVQEVQRHSRLYGFWRQQMTWHRPSTQPPPPVPERETS